MLTQSRRDIMGMPITVTLVDDASEQDIQQVFAYFQSIDSSFSTYKKDSEISLYNRGELQSNQLSLDMQTVLKLSEKTKQQTSGYFDIRQPDGTIDPSGLVKGWAIWQASKLLSKKGIKNFFIEAGGDIQTAGKNPKKEKWRVGIKNPFNTKEIIKIVQLSGEGIATSGTYLRGQHVYNPFAPGKKLTDIISVTVIGPNVYEADRFATAAFAMQKEAILFVENVKGLEGYMIDSTGIATYTSGFENYVYTA